jgi:YbgC/YbaW family acyl-CoA thioester hydrolase
VTSLRRVSWNDCDPSGLVHYKAVFDWFVDTELEFLRERGIEWVFETMPRVDVKATYKRPLRFDNPIAIDVRVVEVGRSAVTYRFTVTAEGQEAAVASVTCVYVENGRSASLPDEVRNALESDRDRP